MFGCVQDGEEPKGEVMANREELAELVSEKIKAILVVDDLFDHQIETVGRLTAIYQMLATKPK